MIEALTSLEEHGDATDYAVRLGNLPLFSSFFFFLLHYDYDYYYFYYFFTSSSLFFKTLFREVAQKKESPKKPKGVNFNGAQEPTVVTAQSSPGWLLLLSSPLLLHLPNLTEIPCPPGVLREEEGWILR